MSDLNYPRAARNSVPDDHPGYDQPQRASLAAKYRKHGFTVDALDETPGKVSPPENLNSDHGSQATSEERGHYLTRYLVFYNARRIHEYLGYASGAEGVSLVPQPCRLPLEEEIVTAAKTPGRSVTEVRK